MVITVLRSKNLEARPDSYASLNRYAGTPPELFPLDIVEDTVTDVVHRLSRGDAPGGLEAVSIKHWIL